MPFQSRETPARPGIFCVFVKDMMSDNYLVSRNGLLYRIKFAQTIAFCLQEQ